MSKLNAKLENLSDQLGGCGLFQIRVFLLCSMAVFMSGIGVVVITFAGYEPKYRCLIPACETSPNATYIEPFLNYSIPYDEIKNTWDSCYTYANISDAEYGTCQSTNTDISLKESCSEWVFDRSIFKSTTVTEFNLTCSDAWLQGVAGSIFMAGMLLGAIFLGDLSDRIGRKKGVVIGLLIFGIGGLLGAVSPNYTLFLISRLIAGIGDISVFQIAFIIVVEYFPSNYRNIVGIMITVPFTLGEATTALIAYCIRDWRYLHLACFLPAFLFISYWWIMPESIRWLVSRGRGEEAKQIVQQISKINNVNISVDTYDLLNIKKEKITISVIDEPIPAKTIQFEEVEERNVFLLLKRPKIVVRTLNLIFCWIVVNFTFYGLGSNASNLSGNIFINCVAIMLIEIPSYVFAYLILDRVGRKGSLSFNLLLGGIACISSGLVSEDKTVLIMVLNLVGKFGAAAAFSIVYIVTAELFPTPYRSLGLGTCSMTSRVGGIIAPLIAELGKIYKPLPLLIFGGISLVSGCLVLTLPETLGAELPMTIQEAEDLGKDQSLFYFPFCSRKKNAKVAPQIS